MASSGIGSLLDRLTDRPAQAARRGARGAIIPKHRAMIQLAWTPRRAARAVVLALAGFLAVVAGLPVIGRLWGRLLGWLVPAIGGPAELGWHTVDVGTVLRIGVPYPLFQGPWPEPRHWVVVGGATVLTLLASFLVPARFLPARYFLRFVAAVQAVSLGYFAFASPPFPYPLPGYIAGLLTAGMAVLALVPVALGFGFYIFDHSLPRQLALTAMIVGHLAVLLPLQGLLHAYLTARLSLLVQPPLFFIFGLLVEVVVFVGLYGWAMSWEGQEIPEVGASPETYR